MILMKVIMFEKKSFLFLFFLLVNHVQAVLQVSEILPDIFDIFLLQIWILFFVLSRMLVSLCRALSFFYPLQTDIYM